MHAHRGQAFQGVTPSFHLSNYQFTTRRDAACAPAFDRWRTCRTLPKWIIGFGAFRRGVLYEVVDELEHVGVFADIPEGVIAVGMARLDQVEDLDHIALL